MVAPLYLNQVEYTLITHVGLQENIFFDGLSGELSAAFAALRLRFYGSDTRCVLSLKSRPVLSAGISRVEEIEEDIDPSIGRACVAEPWRLTGNPSLLTCISL